MDCIFCAIVAGDLPSKQIYSDEAAIAFLDISPVHVGHTLVIPKRHVADFRDDAQAWSELGPAIHATSEILTSRLGCAGINALSSAGAVAGQEVFHLHVHLLPRYPESWGLRNLLPSKRPTVDLDELHERLTG